MRLALLSVLILLFSSCDPHYPGYKKIGGDTYVQLVELGDGEKEVCSSFQVVLSYKLGLLRKGEEGFDYWNDYTFQNVNAEALGAGEIGRKLCNLSEGDHSKYIVPYKDIKDSYLNDYELDSVAVSDSVMMLLDIKVLDLFSEREYQDLLEEKYQQGIIQENTYLKEYLTSNDLIEYFSLQEDVYWRIIDSTDSKKLKSGDHIAIDYEGSFLDGEQFDNTLLDSTSLYFDFGKPNQVIRAFEVVLSHMKEGETAELYVPSHKGFGKKGSTTGIVGAGTPVRFTLRLTEIYDPKFAPIDSSGIVTH